MTSVEIHVVAHPARREQAEKLQAQVEAEELWMDDAGLGEWKNHLRAWTQLSYSSATHAVVLQDDAMPLETFRECAVRAAEGVPDNLVSFYVGTHRPRKQQVAAAVEEAKQTGAGWLTADTLMWGVAVMVPVSRIPEMLSAVEGSKLPYDQRLGSWAEKNGEKVYYTWPSLVDHMDQASTVWKGSKHQQGIRVAHRVGVPDWNDIVVEIEKVTLIPMAESTRDRQK